MSIHDKTPLSSAFSPLRNPFYRWLLIANFFSQIGMWVHDIGAAWLMTSLAPTPIMVALIQTATALPMALLALPAGALADIIDRKRLILTAQIWRVIASASLGILTLLGLVNPLLLLGGTLLLGFGTALGAPAWQAIIPEVVPREEIREAVTLGSVSSNTARGIGPALGGFIVTAIGSGGAFLLNSASLLWIMSVIATWKRTIKKSTLPTERFIGAIRTGMRYVANTKEVTHVLIHTIAFIFSGSAMWAMVPIVARQRLGLGSTGFGILMGVFGVGGLASIFILPTLRRRMDINHQIYLACLLFSLVLFDLAYSPNPILLGAAMFIAGASYLALMSSLMSSLQSMTPSWVLGRVMSLHALVTFGSQAAGSAFWGGTAEVIGLPQSLTCAGIVMVGALAITRRYRVVSGEHLDLSPLKEWTLNPLAERPAMEEGPVMIAIDYRINPQQSAEFITAMSPMKAIRRKYGAVRWLLFRDVANPGHYRESFIVQSWLEHIRQHERFTVSDIAVLEYVNRFNLEGTKRQVEHFIAEVVPKVKIENPKE
jgi:MFS family permease